MSYKRKNFVMFIWPHATIVEACSFAGLFSAYGWIAELCSHFYAQYLAILLLYVIVASLAKQWKMLLVAVPFVAICLCKIVPLYYPRAAVSSDSAARLGVMTLNVNTANRNIGQVVERINQYHPDVISFEEVDQWWLDHLRESLAKDYPYWAGQPQSDNFGIAEFSKLPPSHSEIMEIGEPPVPCIWSEFAFQGKTFSLISIHTLPPGNPLYLHSRNSAFAKIAKLRPKFGERLVIAGDINCTPFSADFDKFVAGTGTYNSMQGFGLQMSWPALMPLYPFFLIPIDHILLSPQLICKRREIGYFMGSDHFPVYAEFEFAK